MNVVLILIKSKPKFDKEQKCKYRHLQKKAFKLYHKLDDADGFAVELGSV